MLYTWPVTRNMSKRQTVWYSLL